MKEALKEDIDKIPALGYNGLRRVDPRIIREINERKRNP